MLLKISLNSPRKHHCRSFFLTVNLLKGVPDTAVFMDWFLYDRDFSQERIKFISDQCSFFIPPENHRNQTKAFPKFPEGIEREHGIKHF